MTVDLIHPGKKGWPYAGSPTGSFTLNRASRQAQGLVGWFPVLGSRFPNRLRDYSGWHNTVTPGSGDVAVTNSALLGQSRIINVSTWFYDNSFLIRLDNSCILNGFCINA